MANFESMDYKGHGVNKSEKVSGLNEYAASLFDPSLTWKDVAWLKKQTKLPIVIKGILTGNVMLYTVHLQFLMNEYLLAKFSKIDKSIATMNMSLTLIDKIPIFKC